MGATNGKDAEGGRPLTLPESDEVRLAVGRLESGARELFTIALVMPIFLAGAEMAAEGFNAAGVLLRDGVQRPLDRIVFVTFSVALFAAALKTRLGARRAAKLLPDALSADPAIRSLARAALLRLAGPRLLRSAASWMAANARKLIVALIAVVAIHSKIIV